MRASFFLTFRKPFAHAHFTPRKFLRFTWLIASALLACMSILTDNLLTQMRGCALEACFKAITVAVHHRGKEVAPEYVLFRADGDTGRKRKVKNKGITFSDRVPPYYKI